MRKRWLQVHLWVALTLGLVVALLGASGALMVVRGPILQWEAGRAAVRLAPHTDASLPYAPQDRWIQAARDGYPQLDRVIGAAPPRGGFLTSDNAIVFGSVKGRDGIGVAAIDPFDASPRAFFVYDDLWLARIVSLHRSLLLPRHLAGPAVAASGIALLVSLASGAWLWWPRGAGWRAWLRALTISRGSRGLRWWRELHNVAAAWLFVPLLMLTLTGVWLARPAWFGWLGLGAAIKPAISALHADLMLGWPGEVLAGLAGVALPLLYVSGLAMWWKKRSASRQAARRRPLWNMRT